MGPFPTGCLPYVTGELVLEDDRSPITGAVRSLLQLGPCGLPLVIHCRASQNLSQCHEFGDQEDLATRLMRELPMALLESADRLLVNLRFVVLGVFRLAMCALERLT